MPFEHMHTVHMFLYKAFSTKKTKYFKRDLRPTQPETYLRPNKLEIRNFSEVILKSY